MTNTHWLVLAGACTIVALVLELVDRFHKPVAWWRTVRGPVAGFLVGLWGVLTFRKTPKPEPVRRPRPAPKPTEFDDAATTQNKKDALDTDIDAAGDAAVGPSVDSLQSELDAL